MMQGSTRAPDKGYAEPPQKDRGNQIGKRKERTRSGCLNCRRKRRKCDETKPVCVSCNKKKEKCEWGMQVTFRAENAHGIMEDHPSMQTRRSTGRLGGFEIKDITAEVIRDYHQYLPLDESASFSRRDLSLPRPTNLVETTADGGFSASNTLCSPESIYTSTPDVEEYPSSNVEGFLMGMRRTAYDCHQDAASSLVGLAQGQLVVSHSVADSTAEVQSTTGAHKNPSCHSGAESPAEGRPHRQQNDPRRSNTEAANIPTSLPIFDDVGQLWSPANGFNEDNIFLPGSAYLELHSTLRNHLIQEVRSNAPTRQVTPDPCRNVEWPAPEAASREARSRQIEVPAGVPTGDLYPPLSPPELSEEEEYKLWKNWLDEISPWLDKFDSQRHFQHTLPIMARSHAHLRYSILALSARQVERKDHNRENARSLALYQMAIHLVLPQLHTRSTAVIASCVVLCVLEMLSSSPKAWRQHLDGCAHLIEAVGVNGFVGGIDQALFWCFARMDVCGGLIASMRTLIPVDRWASNIDLDADIGLFRKRTGFDVYANHAVYLCAQVLNLLASLPHLAERVGPYSTKDDASYADRWTKLWRYIDDWRVKRPAEMIPIMSISSKTNPFPTVLYSNPAAISGNQLYHTATILMLQNKPSSVDVVPKPRSIFWHARQICAISMSNDHHGAWTNSIQPLWIAGQWMSHPSEHKAILELLERIERESGWGTKWRAEDLKEFWGSLEEE